MSDREHEPAAAILAENIKVRRESMQESQLAFAKRCGVTQKQISAIERSVANPTLSTLDAVARGLGIPQYILLRPLR